MQADDLCYWDISSVASLLRRRAISPLEVLDPILRRIERLDPILNVFITRMTDQARQAAREAGQEIFRGQYRGVLHGVPVSVKDLFSVRGVRTTAGSKILEEWVPERDATVTTRLREAGAVLIGKANLHEFALGVTTINPHYGSTRNPWKLDCIPGGSSGGSAAAVAAGFGYASIASDTGGSIRRPAAFCGVVGFKPTYGLVSRQGMLPAAWSLDTVGPIARTVRDAALVLNAIAGRDPRDSTTTSRPVCDYSNGLGSSLNRLRMGVPVAYVSEGVSSEAQGAFWQAVTVLERLGMQRVDLELPAAQYAAVTSSAISLAEVGSIHHRWFLSRPDDYGEDARAVLSVALCLSADDYLKAQRARRVIVNETVMALRQVDVLVTPTIGSGAPPIAKGNAGLGDRPYEVGRHYHVLNRLLSLAGLPAITLPCGFTATGLPLGIQVAGKALDELTVLRVAHAYEAHTSWRNRRPPLDR